MGPANLLYAEPTGYRATMVCFPYDDLARWRGPYPPTVFAEQFEKIAQGWATGLVHFEKAIDVATGAGRAAAESDPMVARAVYLHFASVANQVRFVLARDALRQPNVSDERRRQLRKQIRQLTESEITLAGDLFDVANRDSRIGYEASNHYCYVPLDLVEKVIDCEFIKNRFAQ